MSGRHLPAVTALLALVLFAVTANIVFASLLRVSDEFGVAAEALANVSAVQFAGFFLASIAGGIIADSVGKKRVLQAGSLFVVVGALGWSRAQAPPAAFTAGFVMGLGGGILEAMSTALLTDLYPGRGKLVLNLSQVAYCLGAVGGPLLMAALLPLGVSWRTFFVATAGGALVIFCLFTLAHCPRTAPHTTQPERASHLPLSSAALWIPCVVIFLYVTAEMGTATFLTVFLAEARGAPERWAIQGLAAFWATMIAGRLGCAALPEEQSHKRIIAVLMLAAAACSALHLFSSTWQVDFLLFALTGLAFAGTWPLIVGLAATSFPQRSGTVVGLTAGIGALGCIAAPPLLGPLIGGSNPAAAFALAGALLAAGGLLILYPAKLKHALCEDTGHGDTPTLASSSE